MKSLFSIILLLYFFNSYAQSITDPRLKGLDTVVQKILKDYKAPGVSIAIVEKNKIIYAGGFGYRDLENKLPVTENSLFAIGSCTKAFTATLLGQLADEGKIDLDKPVKTYLPELKFYNEWLTDHVTIRDMMCHRTGLPRHDYSWYGSTASRNELLKRIEYLQPSAELREKYQYNNFMFLAQGVLIEKLTGKSWEQNLKERILSPLGMNTTVMHIADMEKSTDKSFAYTLWKDSFALKIPYRNIDAIGPAGSINSSSKEMAQWLLTWINSGKRNNTQIVPTNFRNQAMTIQMANGAGVPTVNQDVLINGYGLAWSVGSYRGHYRVEHSGGIDGFNTTTSFFPNDSIGIFVCSAMGNVSVPIRNWISDKLLKLPYKDWHGQMRKEFVQGMFASLLSPKKIDSTKLILNTKPSLAHKEYVGTYTHKGYGTVKITDIRGTLQLEYNGLEVPLKHKHYDVFKGRPEGKIYADAPENDYQFQLNKDGKTEKLILELEQGVDPIVFIKDQEIQLDLNKYTGDFTLGPQQMNFVIRNGVLFALIPPQPDYELVPIAQNEFKLKITDGFTIKFTNEVNGKFNTATFNQPNGTFQANRK